jgi:hypothetical protein
VEELHGLLGFTDQCDDIIEYSPDLDVQLIRNVWARKGVLERVRGVKYMLGLFACNELLRQRFGMLDSASCSCCTNTTESPWYVIGECNDDDAVQARSAWGGSNVGSAAERDCGEKRKNGASCRCS